MTTGYPAAAIPVMTQQQDRGHSSLKSSGTSPNSFSTTASENSPTFRSPARYTSNPRCVLLSADEQTVYVSEGNRRPEQARELRAYPELFLYVNNAVFAGAIFTNYFRYFDYFYRQTSGTADIKIERIPN